MLECFPIKKEKIQNKGRIKKKTMYSYAPSSGMLILSSLMTALITFPVSLIIAMCVRDAHCKAKKIEDKKSKEAKKLFWTTALVSLAFSFISNLYYMFNIYR